MAGLSSLLIIIWLARPDANALLQKERNEDVSWHYHGLTSPISFGYRPVRRNCRMVFAHRRSGGGRWHSIYVGDLWSADQAKKHLAYCSGTHFSERSSVYFYRFGHQKYTR